MERMGFRQEEAGWTGGGITEENWGAVGRRWWTQVMFGGEQHGGDGKQTSA